MILQPELYTVHLHQGDGRYERVSQNLERAEATEMAVHWCKLHKTAMKLRDSKGRTVEWWYYDDFTHEVRRHSQETLTP